MRLPHVPAVVRSLASIGAGTALLLVGTPAAAAPTPTAGVWIEVSPTSVTAGSSVDVKAGCDDVAQSAQVNSKAFGSMTVSPENTTLYGRVTVPASLAAGGYDVTLTCPSGSTATTTVWVLSPESQATSHPSSYGPRTGGGFLALGDSDGPAGRIWLTVGVVTLLTGATLGVRALRRRTPARTR